MSPIPISSIELLLASRTICQPSLSSTNAVCKPYLSLKCWFATDVTGVVRSIEDFTYFVCISKITPVDIFTDIDLQWVSSSAFFLGELRFFVFFCSSQPPTIMRVYRSMAKNVHAILGVSSGIVTTDHSNGFFYPFPSRPGFLVRHSMVFKRALPWSVIVFPPKTETLLAQPQLAW